MGWLVFWTGTVANYLNIVIKRERKMLAMHRGAQTFYVHGLGRKLIGRQQGAAQRLVAAVHTVQSRSTTPLWHPIGTQVVPVPDDRKMSLTRFAAALALRERASWPWGSGPPLPITITTTLHASALYAAFIAPSPGGLELALCAASYSLRMFGITGGYHRYFSHGSYETSRVFQGVLAVLGASAWQKGPLWWASHHVSALGLEPTHCHAPYCIAICTSHPLQVEHHIHSDTPRDTHSPVSGSFVWAHMGWFWASAEYDPPPQRFIDGRSRVSRFGKLPELMLLDRFHAVPGFGLMGACYALDGGMGMLWGFAVPTVLGWHATFAVNSVCHAWGERPFATSDNSRNNPLVALLTLGEGWHNNHHAFAWSARQGLEWWQLDVTYGVLRMLERLGLVWNLKEPPTAQIARAKQKALRAGFSRTTHPQRELQ